MQVLPDSAMVDPATTHILSEEQPYFLEKPEDGSEPAGTLPAGSQVRLVSKGSGGMSVVQDAEGRQVYTAFAGLRAVR